MILLTYCRALIGDTIPDEGSLNNQKDIEERRRKLIFELNSSGKYYAFKEKLKVRHIHYLVSSTWFNIVCSL